MEIFIMHQIYVDHEKTRLALALGEAKTAEEIENAASAIAEMWMALGCPADM
jgi:hypothetical protein